ncbi:MAG: PH domain-containing protein [Micromonosporaceae bacterium]|nr:PH domain-containing protein [Micromonosporaceae bacterium]
MARWRRPYRARDRLIAQAFAVVASVLWLGTVLYYTVVRPATSAWWLPPLAIGSLIAAIVIQLRVNAQGVAVGEPGIRVRTAWRTRIVPWSDVRQVLVVDDPRYRNRALVIDTHGGERIPTPIFRDADRPFRSGGPLGYVGLFGSDLDALAQTLNETAREHNKGHDRPPTLMSGGTPS